LMNMFAAPWPLIGWLWQKTDENSLDLRPTRQLDRTQSLT
jgi:hypothetical protein